MSQEIISHFKERPKLKITWWAMWLGLAMIFSGPILGISAALIVPFFTKITSEKVASGIGFGLMFIMLGVLIAALITSIKSYRLGERSWVMWVGLIPATLGCLFWIFMLIGEFIFEH